MGFPEEFFSEVVWSETQRALEAIGDDDKVVAWVSTGRSPHAGDAMTARDLHNISGNLGTGGIEAISFSPGSRPRCGGMAGDFRTVREFVAGRSQRVLAL